MTSSLEFCVCRPYAVAFVCCCSKGSQGRNWFFGCGHLCASYEYVSYLSYPHSLVRATLKTLEAKYEIHNFKVSGKYDQRWLRFHLCLGIINNHPATRFIKISLRVTHCGGAAVFLANQLNGFMLAMGCKRPQCFLIALETDKVTDCCWPEMISYITCACCLRTVAHPHEEEPVLTQRRPPFI